MAFSTGGNGRDSRTMNEINVTPFVDVMLVLLIVFMISAPLLQSGVELELPEASIEMQANPESVIVSIDKAGRHYLNDTYLQPEIVVEKVKAAVYQSKEKPVYLRADKSLSYGVVMEFMGRLQREGISQVSLITEPLTEGR